MPWFTHRVLVTFVDDATGVTVATSHMPPERLPDSFEVETTLKIRDVEWSVVHAAPQTRPEYTKSGKLTLRLRKIEMISPEEIGFSQLDVTERFDDNLKLGKDEWIGTIPLNTRITNLESSGLPLPNANAEEVYRVAMHMSELRELVSIPGDGVYCPICHIANIDQLKLRTPCPRCGRALLLFGWT